MMPTKETLIKLRAITEKNWNRYCLDSSLKNWQRHLKSCRNYNRVFDIINK